MSKFIIIRKEIIVNQIIIKWKIANRYIKFLKNYIELIKRNNLKFINDISIV